MPIKVIVVDDSFFMRKVISDALNSDPDIKVIDTAKDGIECLEKAVRLNPDVITLDIDMPIMDGLTALKHLTKEHPTPVIMLSALTREGADETFKALQYGAADFVPKPSGMLDFDTVKEELINKVKNISKVDLKKSLPKYIPSSIIEVPRKIKSKIIIIGASTGGPPAIEDILSRIPKLQVSIFIVQHMHPNFTRYFAERLNRKCIMGVMEAKEDDRIETGKVLVAHGDYHLVIENEKVGLNKEPKVNSVRPSVDVTMKSAAEIYEDKVIGVLLTGMGKDGANGLKTIKEKNGKTIVQDESTSIIFGMPKAAIDAGVADIIAPLHKIPQEIIKMLK